VDRRLNAERLVVALDQTLNDTQIGDRAPELARRVRRDHGVEVGCGVIESRLISRAHVRDLRNTEICASSSERRDEDHKPSSGSLRPLRPVARRAPFAPLRLPGTTLC
jgi:hypothetical protein